MGHKQTLGLLFPDPIEAGEEVTDFIGGLGGHYLRFFARPSSISVGVLASIIVFRDRSGGSCHL